MSRCKATTLSSRRCKSNTTNENGFCHSHQPSEPPEPQYFYETRYCGCIRVFGGDIHKSLKCARCQLSELSRELGKEIKYW